MLSVESSKYSPSEVFDPSYWKNNDILTQSNLNLSLFGVQDVFFCYTIDKTYIYRN